MIKRNILSAALAHVLGVATLGCAPLDGEDNASELTGEQGSPNEEVSEKTQALTGCVPGPWMVAVFEGLNFSGQCVTYSVGRYPFAFGSGASGANLPNDTITSYKIGANVALKVCGDAAWTGSCYNAETTDRGDLRQLGFNDAISSLEVYPRTGLPAWPGPDDVLLNANLNFGDCHDGVCYAHGGVRSNVAVGRHMNMNYTGIANDALTGIRIGSNRKVRLCRALDMQTFERCEDFVGPINLDNLTGYWIGNDTVSSLTVSAK
jgi:hypothetical protein